MRNMLIVLAIFFTFTVTAKIHRVLKNQFYTDLCIKMIRFQIYYLQFTIKVTFVSNRPFFKSSNRMIHPSVFLILR